jgi:hypothetical protein
MIKTWNFKAWPALFWLLIFLAQGCEKSYLEADSVLIPAGRNLHGPGSVDIMLNGEKTEPELTYDQCGGYWYRIPAEALDRGDRLIITYTTMEGDTALFQEELVTSGLWLEPSYYIDSDHKEILKKAEELCHEVEGSFNSARKMQLHLSAYFGSRVYDYSFKDKASESLAIGYGTCMNFSRLFVALCRSIGIPARTVWGVVYNHDDNGIFDYHHQWAEFQDEDGHWHPLDFGYTTHMDLDDLRYIDLLYGAEENPLLKNRISEYPVLGDVKYFKDYPAAMSGMLGFRLEEDNRPDNMVVSYTFNY